MLQELVASEFLAVGRVIMGGGCERDKTLWRAEKATQLAKRCKHILGFRTSLGLEARHLRVLFGPRPSGLYQDRDPMPIMHTKINKLQL